MIVVMISWVVMVEGIIVTMMVMSLVWMVVGDDGVVLKKGFRLVSRSFHTVSLVWMGNYIHVLILLFCYF